MIEYYTTLQLTRRSDLLPALAGIATQMMKVRKKRYLWGIWEDSLRSDIAWFLDLPYNSMPTQVGWVLCSVLIMGFRRWPNKVHDHLEQ